MDALGVIQRLGGGRLMELLAAALTEVAQSVVLTEKPGSVTLTLKLAKVASQDAVIVTEAIKQGLPVAASRGALFYAVGDGALHLEDPRQTVMEFRTVDVETGEIRELPATQRAAREAF